MLLLVGLTVVRVFALTDLCQVAEESEDELDGGIFTQVASHAEE